jgi:hypothetical protein
MAQAETISVFADAMGSACSVVDQQESVFTVYIIHHYANCSISVEMSVVEGGGFGATYLNETHLSFVQIGDFRSGIAIGYGEAKNGTILIGTMQYAGHGTSTLCSWLDTSGSPNSPGIPTPYPLVQDCSFYLYPGTSRGPLYVNPASGCDGWCVVATQPATWGRVKALYRN